jgi:hypothetical protein
MHKNFQVDFVSPVEFENLAAEVSFLDQVICRIKNERADNVLEVEFFAVLREPVLPVIVPLEDLMKLMQEVSAELRQSTPAS